MEENRFRSNKRLSVIIEQQDNPKNYFSVDIGNKKFGPRFDNNMNLVPYTIIGSKELFENNLIRRINTFIPPTSPLKLNSVNPFAKKEEKLIYNSNIIRIDNNEISKLYDSYKKRINENKNVIIKENLPFNIKESLNKQENLLKYNLKMSKNRDDLNKFICKKSKKKEEELLINSSPLHRIKSEFNKLIDKKKPTETSLNVHDWILGLRSKPDEPFKGTFYVNGGSESNPIWSRRKLGNKINSVDFIRPSNIENFHPKLESFKNSKFVKNSVEKYKINLDNFFNLDEMKIQGKNVLEEENKSTLNMRGRKIFHKEAIIDKNDETIQLDYLTNHERSLSDLSLLKSHNYRESSGVKRQLPLLFF